MGTTVIYSSGDRGVAGRSGCLNAGGQPHFVRMSQPKWSLGRIQTHRATYTGPPSANGIGFSPQYANPSCSYACLPPRPVLPRHILCAYMTKRTDDSLVWPAYRFPVVCPFVTAVGATQIVPTKTVNDPESACETVIFSGGTSTSTPNPISSFLSC